MSIVHVDSVSDVKTGQYGVSSKIISGRDHYYINEDGTQYVGKDVELGDIQDKTSKGGNKYKVAKILGVVSGSSPAHNGNGSGVAWEAYEAMAKLAHGLAMELEPDGVESGETQTAGEDHTLALTTVDRSSSRAAILNTVMIAFSNGKVSLPEGEESPF